MNVRNPLVDLNKEFYRYKNDIFLTKFFKKTGSTCLQWSELALEIPARNFCFEVCFHYQCSYFRSSIIMLHGVLHFGR